MRKVTNEHTRSRHGSDCTANCAAYRCCPGWIHEKIPATGADKLALRPWNLQTRSTYSVTEFPVISNWIFVSDSHFLAQQPQNKQGNFHGSIVHFFSISFSTRTSRCSEPELCGLYGIHLLIKVTIFRTQTIVWQTSTSKHALYWNFYWREKLPLGGVNGTGGVGYGARGTGIAVPAALSNDAARGHFPGSGGYQAAETSCFPLHETL